MKTNALQLIAFKLIVCTALSSEALAGSTGAPADSVSIATIIANLDSAWAHGDADRWAADFADDAEFINILGMVMTNKQAMRDRHYQIFTGVFKGSRYQSALRRVRFLGNDVAIADVDIEVTGFSALPPGAQPTAPGVLRTRMRHVLHRIDGRWWIVASQNTAIAPRPAEANK
jgi:uncharacterized protein (TIGR02246 family)